MVDNLLMTIDEAAETFFRGKQPRTIRTWINRGLIPQNAVKKIGGAVFLKTKELEEFISS